MRTADIKVPGVYRAQGGAKVEVTETGVTGRWSNQRSNVRATYLTGPREGQEVTLATRDIVREWTDLDDALAERAAERDQRQEDLNAELGQLGFFTALATVTRDRSSGELVPTLRFKGDEAERVLALLREEVRS